MESSAPRMMNTTLWPNAMHAVPRIQRIKPIGTTNLPAVRGQLRLVWRKNHVLMPAAELFLEEVRALAGADG